MQSQASARHRQHLGRTCARVLGGVRAKGARCVAARAFSDVEDSETVVESRVEAVPPPKPRSRSRRLPHLSAKGVLTSILPEVEGDAKDWFWMITSIAVFTYLAACLFMVYMHLYYSAGFVTIADCLSR